jgi:hypothetical protein
MLRTSAHSPSFFALSRGSSPEQQDLVERAVEAVERLARQPVDEVEVDGAKAVRARFFHHAARHLHALDAMHRLLHCRFEVLHADRQAPEAELGEERDASRLGAARVDLDRVFGLRAAREAPLDHVDELAHLLAREEVRRAAAPVHLLERRRVGQ